MKNVQVIDGAINSIFEIYAVSDDVFQRIFPGRATIAFAEEIPDSDPLWTNFYSKPVRKEKVNGIHGTLHLTGKEDKNSLFPTRREEDAK